MLRRIISVGAETVEKTSQSSRAAKQSRIFNRPRQRVQWVQDDFAAKTITKAKLKSTHGRGACPVQQLAKTFEDRLCSGAS